MRTYLVGLPVSITVNDDGTIAVEVSLEDASEAIRDECGVQYGDEDSVAALTMEDVETDAATFEEAYTNAGMDADQFADALNPRITIAFS